MPADIPAYDLGYSARRYPKAAVAVVKRRRRLVRGAFRVAARFPMDWYQRRVFYAEELDAFLKLLKAEGECGN